MEIACPRKYKDAKGLLLYYTNKEDMATYKQGGKDLNMYNWPTSAL